MSNAYILYFARLFALLTTTQIIVFPQLPVPLAQLFPTALYALITQGVGHAIIILSSSMIILNVLTAMIIFSTVLSAPQSTTVIYVILGFTLIIQPIILVHRVVK